MSNNNNKIKKIRKQTKIWVTEDGRRIRICDMDDGHLHNTIKMFVRSFKAYLRNAQIQILDYLGSGPPDGAERCASLELGHIEELIYETFGVDLSIKGRKSLTVNEFIKRTEVLEAQKRYPILRSMVKEVQRRKAIVDLRKEKYNEHLQSRI